MPLRSTSLVLMMCSACAGVLAAEPSTYTVKPVPFRIDAKLEGTFEPPAIAEVRPDIRRWSQLVVEEAVPHGTRVGKGDVLVRLDTEKLDETIRDLEVAGRLTDAGVKLLEREAAVLAKATPIQLEMAARSRRMVREDLERYEAREADLATALNDKQLESAEFSLANAEEELEQLEKMYEQDDLTEETEEIVLKRSRFEAEMARFNAALARDRHERVAGFDLPRRIEYLKSLDRLATLDFELSEHKLPLSLEKQRLELEKARGDQRKAAATLAELKAERARLPIRSPTDGIVYYGKWRQGKWTESETAAGKLRPGGQLDGRDTIMTVVRVGKPTVRVSVPEKELSRIAAGQPARVVPKAFADVRLAGRVRAVTSVPVAVGRFEALIDIAEENPRLVAGMEADVRVVSESKPDALAVPKRAVFSDPLDDDKRFVYVYQGDGKEPQMRTVAVGRSNDELVVITAGLGVGERIMLEKPAGADGVKLKAEDGEKAAAKPKPDGGAAKPAKAPDEKPAKTQDEKPAAGATPPAKSGDASQSTAAQK